MMTVLHSTWGTGDGQAALALSLRSTEEHSWSFSLAEIKWGNAERQVMTEDTWRHTGWSQAGMG